MKDHRVPGFLMVLVLLLFLIGFSGLVGAQTQTPSVSSYKGPAVKTPAPAKAPAFPNASSGDAVLSVTGSALKPREMGMNFHATNSGGGLYCNEVSDRDFFNTPVHLPKGTVVKSLRMYFYDNVQDNWCAGFFTVYDLYGNFVAEWSAISPVGIFGSGYADSPVINHTIDYTQYTYLLNWFPGYAGSNLQLLSLQLNYKPAPGGTAVIPLY